MLSVLDGVLGTLGGCEAGTLPELLADVLQLINKHPFVQVLAGAAACLTTLAAKEPVAAAALANSAAVYAGWLRDPTGQGGSGGARPAPALLCRFLYIMGQLCRRGADVLERTPPEGGSPPLAMPECQRIFVQYCGARENLKVRRASGGGGSTPWHPCFGGRGSDAAALGRPLARPYLPSHLPHLQVAEAALGALGALSIARPSVLVDKRAPAHRILKAALAPVRGQRPAAWGSGCDEGLAGRAVACQLEPSVSCTLGPIPCLVSSHPAQAAPEPLKLRALANLIELLRADEETMSAAQQDSTAAAADGGLPTVAGGARKKGGRKKGGAAAAAEEAEERSVAVPVQNGMGDTLSQSSSILQARAGAA